MSNNDDPFQRPDATRVRPRPGAGRRTYAESRQPAAPASRSGEALPLSLPDRGLLGIGLNPLVQAATPILLLTAQMRETMSMDVAGLRRLALDEIRRFEEQARGAGVPAEVVLSARYTLCAGLDEAVLSTPWGHQSEWAQHPLLVALHREAWGGEKFFDMLDRISQDPSRYIDLMELQYLCLAFGFAGKYQIQARGQEHLQEIQHDLYRKIHGYRGQSPQALSVRWRGLEERSNPLVRYLPWWVVGAAALPILAITFTVYYASLAGLAAPVHAELAKVGLEDFSAPAPVVPVRGPTLKQLLAADERGGALSVEEQGNRTVVTLLAPDLFPSGSADVNPVDIPTLQRITAALDKVPGRVLVVGHTDDQPIRSLRYRDNFELSRERAVSVVRVLQQGIDNKARLVPDGVGSSQPRYRPESTPENRSRNRRVEIIHVRGT
ncbi:MAG TPA: type IVB secretion system protein IcmH/DotU [Vicinamibacterales bacterium]|nr:type IVB secretion system protein IcmH/DotU [Vicinamibacterales bacterium]